VTTKKGRQKIEGQLQ